MAEAGAPRCVAVAVPAPLDGALTYRVPDAWPAPPGPGARVRVPLGRRTVTGVVTGPVDPPGGEVVLRDLIELLDPPERPALPADLLAALTWTASYYLAPLGETLRAALPAAITPREEGYTVLTAAGRDALRDPGAGAPEALAWLAARPAGRARLDVFAERLGPRAALQRAVAAGFVVVERDAAAPSGLGRAVRRVTPSDAARRDPDAALASLGRAIAQRRLLEAALARGAAPASELAAEAKTGPDAVNALVRAGWLVESFERAAVPDLPDPGFPATRPPRLTPEQDAAVGTINAALDEGAFRPVLLYGVTGSGKTEVYLRAAEHALAMGRSALFLVPEIGLTPQLAHALGTRFDAGVVVLHSGLSDRQRHEAWERARDGRARIVVGARSALFAPLARPALIVVDEEHDGGYKQEESPRYHARDVALVRGREAGAVVVLGSATPSMEAMHLARQGRAALLRLPQRASGGTLASVEMVDMRAEFRETKADRPLSRRLVAALREALAGGEQSIVLLNRRGYTSALLCRACGEPVGCPACSIALTWHRVGERLRCHYCGHARPRPDACPACRSPHLADIGSGTQRAEEAVLEQLPEARVARLDRDTVRSAQRLADTLGRFARGELDVLVGTQMIAKGHHFPNVTVVGVLSADAALHLPDFRAGERTFQLLTQVAGRAGRGERPGRVLVQAFSPDHAALRAAAAQDYDTFAERELAARAILRYPPDAAIASVLVRDAVQERAHERAAGLAARIREAGEGKVAVLGPTAAPLARLRGLWRVQLLVRAHKRARLAAALRAGIAAARAGDGTLPVWLAVDVDPQQLL